MAVHACAKTRRPKNAGLHAAAAPAIALRLQSRTRREGSSAGRQAAAHMPSRHRGASARPWPTATAAAAAALRPAASHACTAVRHCHARATTPARRRLRGTAHSPGCLHPPHHLRFRPTPTAVALWPPGWPEATRGREADAACRDRVCHGAAQQRSAPLLDRCTAGGR